MIYQPKVTTQPTSEPVTSAEAKLHLRVDTSDEDTLIAEMIKTARQWCEAFQNRAYITQTITLKMDEFPLNGDYCEIVVPRPPLVSVTSIKYYDTSGIQQTLSSSVYTVDTYSEPGRIGLAHAQSWPGVRGDLNGVEVIYVAGYGSASSVPERVKTAIKLMITDMFENRGDGQTVKENTMAAVRNLLSVDRIQFV